MREVIPCLQTTLGSEPTSLIRYSTTSSLPLWAAVGNSSFVDEHIAAPCEIKSLPIFIATDEMMAEDAEQAKELMAWSGALSNGSTQFGSAPASSNKWLRSVNTSDEGKSMNKSELITSCKTDATCTTRWSRTSYPLAIRKRHRVRTRWRMIGSFPRRRVVLCWVLSYISLPSLR